MSIVGLVGVVGLSMFDIMRCAYAGEAWGAVDRRVQQHGCLFSVSCVTLDYFPYRPHPHAECRSEACNTSRSLTGPTRPSFACADEKCGGFETLSTFELLGLTGATVQVFMLLAKKRNRFAIIMFLLARIRAAAC